jgi:hypothetical protein
MNKDKKKFQPVDKKKPVEQKKPDMQELKKAEPKSGACGCSKS